MSSLVTLDQIRDNILSTVRDTQITTIVDNFINLAGLEIHNAYPWTWKRRKQTFSTVADQEDYNLDSEIDQIAMIRQLSTPVKLLYVPDHQFYKFVPNPEERGSGTPRFYRLWEETGFATNLAAADTIYVVSSSTSDGSSFTVRVHGRNSSGELITETITLNGTTNVPSTNTFAASGLFSVSKSAQTTGTISVYRTTGATLLSELEPDNLNPRFKRVSLFPIPSAVTTMYIEYYERYHYLVHDTDVPQMDTKWNWVLREGALAKTWSYKQNETAMAQHQALFDRGLKAMIFQDSQNMDYIPYLEPRLQAASTVIRDSDSVGGAYPGYSLNPYAQADCSLNLLCDGLSERR